MTDSGHTPARAFTLIELVLVIAIVSITAAIAVPRFAGSMDRYRVDAAARRVALDIELMRERARASSAPVTILFDVGIDQYLVAGEGVDGATDYVVSLSRAPYEARIATVDVGGTAQIDINGYGEASATGRIVLRSGNARRTVFVGTSEATIEVGDVASPTQPLDLGGGNTAPLD